MKTEGNTIDKNDERKVNLVPVRLASESVDLKKLKKFMSRRSLEIMEKTDKSEYAQGFEYGFCKAFTEVENWAEKEAKK